jgi:hypothetical protein
LLAGARSALDTLGIHEDERRRGIAGGAHQERAQRRRRAGATDSGDQYVPLVEGDGHLGAVSEPAEPNQDLDNGDCLCRVPARCGSIGSQDGVLPVES